MTILTEKLQDEIIQEWINIRNKTAENSSPFFLPRPGEIPTRPLVKAKNSLRQKLRCQVCERERMFTLEVREDLDVTVARCLTCRKKQMSKPTTSQIEQIKEKFDWFEKYEAEVVKKIQQHEKINNLCYLYVTFRRQNVAHSFPDVDNLLKSFFDIIKRFLLNDDRQIIGVKANTVGVFGREQEGVSFTLIPAYKLEIKSVERIKEEELKNLNQLRKMYLAELEQPVETTWRQPMQMIMTNLGTFFDSFEGKLWSIEPHELGDDFLHKPEPGFNWESKIYEKTREPVNGVMIYERSGCWWINKWAE